MVEVTHKWKASLPISGQFQKRRWNLDGREVSSPYEPEVESDLVQQPFGRYGM